ncbi:uncharacterized protein LOC143858806 [Tasmannia lanceolata]|uniref:uncharacterized protein LOC143858806 n=1 Tax=Tasmannia lanceolata TaxID=3420 RepID=UPI0040638777
MSTRTILDWIRGTLRESHIYAISEQEKNLFGYVATIKLDWGLLYAASECWDPDHHVFRFDNQEMCPTFEEWCALLEYPVDGPLVKPSCVPDYRPLFLCLMDNPDESMNSFMKGQEVSMQRLIDIYPPVGYIGAVDIQKARRRALRFCSFARFLTVQPSRFASAVLLDLVDQMDRGANPIPTMLAETFNGLDDMAHLRASSGPSSYIRSFVGSFSGCPALLQVWLCHKLKIAAPVHFDHTLYTFSEWRHDVSFDHKSDWVEWLNSRQEDQIYWQIPGIQEAVFNTGEANYVRLLGLKKTSFYVPASIQRQYGREQSIVPPLHHFYPPEGLKPKIVKAVSSAWDARIIKPLKESVEEDCRPKKKSKKNA